MLFFLIISDRSTRHDQLKFFRVTISTKGTVSGRGTSNNGVSLVLAIYTAPTVPILIRTSGIGMWYVVCGMWCVLGTPGMEKFRKITFSFGNCTHGPQRQYMPRIRGLLAVHSLGHIKHFSAGSDLCRIYLSSLVIYFSPFSICKLSHRPCPS